MIESRVTLDFAHVNTPSIFPIPVGANQSVRNMFVKSHATPVRKTLFKWERKKCRDLNSFTIAEFSAC